MLTSEMKSTRRLVIRTFTIHIFQITEIQLVDNNQTMNQSTETETIEMMDDGVMTGMYEDDDDEGATSPESTYNDDDMKEDEGRDDDVTAQLAAAGVVGVAAAAAISSAKKRKRPHSFETNPSIRKRQQNRLLRKLRVCCSTVR